MGGLSAVVPLNDCGRELEQLAQPVQDGQNRYSGFNPLSPEATKVFEAIPDGSHSMNGFRNKDLKKQLFGDTKSAKELKQMSSKTTRIIKKTPSASTHIENTPFNEV
ncbi:hypothetical protein BAC3_01700 [uncultured bacterium]|nr:hypothetical protein BAC3_01700 [uncultured bacterium]